MYGGYGIGGSWIFWLLAVTVLGFVAQAKVKSTFSKYSQILAASGVAASDMARRMLYDHGSSVTVTEVGGTLTDHYDPRSGMVGLSDSVYPSRSVGALAVAAHEIGHVMQYESEYIPIKIRNTILPVAQLGSTAAPYIVILGYFLGSFNLAMVGVYLFLGMLLFQLVTLPVEFNASRRGVQMLEEGGYLSADETPGAKKVLRAAAMTYVVAALASLVSLLRLLSMANASRRR